MKCPECQTDNRDGVKFCEECGSKMEIKCPSCGAKIPLGKKFCGECGHKLDETPAPPSPDYDQPKSYTPKFMADKILTTRSSIEGEHKLVTVLFADVANFTGISESLEPEDVHQIMDGCFKILMDEIHKYEGTINQFTGDGVMALFGAPLSHEDHGQRACFASLAIQAAMRTYGENIKSQHGVDFNMRIGLNSGSVVVGAIGDDLRMDYTAIGDTTNLAARMESMAKPGGILVTRNTFKLIKEYFELNSLGEVQVKGKSEAQEVFQLTGTSKVITRLDASATRGLTKFIGRGEEIETLAHAFEKARSGSGQVVGIVGEAGVGKSRLIFELRKSLQDEVTYLEGRCVQIGESIPFLPLLDVMKGYFDINEGDQEAIIQGKLKEKIGELDDKLLKDLPALEDLLSLSVDDETWVKLEPKEKRDRTFEALRDLLIRLSQEKPLILVIDDLHWMDKTSEEFLDYLIGWLAHAQILLLLLYRPEYTHPWGSKSFYNKIGLDQLTLDRCAELVQSILEGGEVVPEIRELILSRSAGNPLFMEELTRTLMENGTIQKTDHQYILSVEASEVKVPETVQGIIAARMDRLEDTIKRTMQVAAVIGRDFAYRILEIITGMRDDLKSYLLRLQDLEFIYEKSLFPELEYIFKHAVTQEVAYNSLLSQKKKEIHEKIGTAIEEVHGEKLEEFFEMLAHHYSKTNNFEKAYHFLKLAGNKVMRNNSASEAFGYYKEALSVLKKLPESEENTRKQLAIIHNRQVPIITLGFPECSLSILQEGEKIATALDDKKSLIRFYSNMGFYHSTSGKPTEGRKYSGKAFEEAEKIQDVESMAHSGPDIVLSYAAEGNYKKAIDLGARVINMIEKTHMEKETFGGPANVYPAMLSGRGYGMGMLGNFEQALNNCEKALADAVSYGNKMTQGIAEYFYGFVLMNKGDWEMAKGHLQKGIQLCEEASFLQPLAQVWSGLGVCDAVTGDPEVGRAYVEKGLKIHRDAHVEWNTSIHFYSLSICHYHAGDLGKAIDLMREAYELSEKSQERHSAGKSLIWLGRMTGKADSQKENEAVETIQKGMEILNALETRPDVSIAHLFLGELYGDVGRVDKASGPLKEAAEMFEEMGMDYWLKKTRAILEKL
jgi:class 3 adenylate cyclase/tetratricopeptide (TPR) repeat protein